MTSFYKLLKQFPPCRVRLLARHAHGAPMTHEEIADASGMHVHHVYVLSQMTSWDLISIDQIQRFTHACGLDLDKPASVKRKQSYSNGKYVKGKRFPPTFRYLRQSPIWDNFYRPLIEKWRDSVYAANRDQSQR